MYRVYVTDCLKSIIGASARYYDVINRNSAPADERDPEEIISHIKLGLDELRNEA